MNTQYESSVAHQRNLESGLQVTDSHEFQAERNDDRWSVVSYSDGSVWLFTNGYAEPIDEVKERELMAQIEEQANQ